MSKNKIKFNLLSNAEDSLRHAVGHITSEEQSAGDYKRAILDVFHVIELILKERIIKVHPAFIWEDIDKYPDLRKRTIGVSKAISRLAKFAKVVLPEKFKQTIEKCRELRNRIQHSEVDIPFKEAKMIIGKMLAIIFLFSKQYLNRDFEGEFKKDDTWKVLIDIYEFWEAQSEIVEKRLFDEKRLVWECPSCSANTFDVGHEECALCGHHERLIVCDFCKNEVFESSIEEIEGEDVGLQPGEVKKICENCLYPPVDEKEFEKFRQVAEATWEEYSDKQE